MVAPQILGWLALTAALGWTLHESSRQVPAAQLGWRWWVLVGLILLSFRWPLLWTLQEYNPDEGQLIAGAFTLRHDPLFWRSVDGHTAGPLVFYPLLPVAWSHGLAAFALARLIALGLTLATLYFAAGVVASAAGTLAARAAVLPAAAFVGFTSSTDFLFYSTELAPICLLAAGCFVARPLKAPRASTLAGAGVLLGCAPWAKMQIGPMAAVIWLAIALHAWSTGYRRGVAVLAVCTLLPSVLGLSLIWLTGQITDWAIPFALNHFVFIGSSSATLPGVSAELWQAIASDGYLACWVVGGLTFTALAAALVRTPDLRLRQLAAVAIALLLAATACVLAPRRPFTHYLHLLELPLLLVSGCGLGLAIAHAGRRRARVVVALFLAGTLGPQLARRGGDGEPWWLRQGASLEPEEQLLVGCLRHYTTPGEALGIWGWRSSLYVGAGLRQATRQGQSEEQLRPNRWQSYFRQRYLDDLAATRPPAFVDAVGVTNFVFRDRRDAHEAFPALRDWIAAHYTLVLDTGGTRVYIHRDRLTARGAWRPVSRGGTGLPAARGR